MFNHKDNETQQGLGLLWFLPARGNYAKVCYKVSNTSPHNYRKNIGLHNYHQDTIMDGTLSILKPRYNL